MYLNGFSACLRLYWNDEVTKQKILSLIEENDPDTEYIEQKLWFESEDDYSDDDCTESDFYDFYHNLQNELEKNGIHYEMNLSTCTDDGIETEKRAFNGTDILEKSYNFNAEDIKTKKEYNAAFKCHGIFEFETFADMF